MKDVLTLSFVVGVWGMFITMELSGISTRLREINDTLKKLTKEGKRNE